MLRLAVITVAMALLAAAPTDARTVSSSTTVDSGLGAPVQAPVRYYEIRQPAGPVGTVLVIHGGGWLRVGAPEVRYEESEASRLRGYGWRTINVDYRPGRRSLRDAVDWYDWTRAHYGGPVCLFGRSAGAHLALMVASRRRPDCVIGHGAITDLAGVHGTVRAAQLRREFIAPSFGSRTARFSPVRHPARRGIPVLLATAAGDDLGGCRQLASYRLARPLTRTFCLPSGAAPFMHADVDAGALVAQHERERSLLTNAASRARR